MVGLGFVLSAGLTIRRACDVTLRLFLCRSITLFGDSAPPRCIG